MPTQILTFFNNYFTPSKCNNAYKIASPSAVIGIKFKIFDKHIHLITIIHIFGEIIIPTATKNNGADAEIISIFK